MTHRLIRLGLPALLALAGACAIASPASADLVFRASVSGTYDQQWKVDQSDPDATHCIVGGGEQSVTFKTASGLLIHGGIEGSGNPSSNGKQWQFGPFKVKGTVSRTDTTARDSTGDCSGGEPLPPHNCGGPRSFTVKKAYIYKYRGTRKARFHVEFENFDPANLFQDTPQCFAPDADLSGGDFTFSARWPGDRGIKPHHSYTFAGTENFGSEKNDPFYLPSDVSVPLDISTAFPWKARLRPKCYAARLTGLKCQ